MTQKKPHLFLLPTTRGICRWCCTSSIYASQRYRAGGWGNLVAFGRTPQEAYFNYQYNMPRVWA